MPSIQDIETRLQQVERMVRFVMVAFQFADPANPFSKPQTLLDKYYQLMTQGRVVVTDTPSDPTPTTPIEDEDGSI